MRVDARRRRPTDGQAESPVRKRRLLSRDLRDSVNVLTLRGTQIEEITAFLTPDAFRHFGLPETVPA